jgi:hypothetical protein
MDGGRGRGGGRPESSGQGHRRTQFLLPCCPVAVARLRGQSRVGLLRPASRVRIGDCWAVLVSGWAIGLPGVFMCFYEAYFHCDWDLLRAAARAARGPNPPLHARHIHTRTAPHVAAIIYAAVWAGSCRTLRIAAAAPSVCATPTPLPQSCRSLVVAR